ncbi:hypothetical protein LIER_41324 [Lithospermum erythrorhizon]|uniref:Uncharacterized protein n=1 Tax=Lithospermum erythrorhizon TaxID=34254 RepID=A0AAV3R947_LITER
MLFSYRDELKAAIDTYSIKDARDIKYVKMRRKGLKWCSKMKSVSGSTHDFKAVMEQMKSLDVVAFNWFEDKDPRQWSRVYFTITSKCDVLLNNMCEVFNAFILDARDNLY